MSLLSKPTFVCSDEILNGAHVALDVDGTLARGLSHDPEENFGNVVTMLKELYSRGVEEVFMATGRPPWSAKEWIENTFADVDEPYVLHRFMNSNHVLFDGAVVCDLKGNNIFEKAIPRNSREQIVQIMENVGLQYGFDTVGSYFRSKDYMEVYFPSDQYMNISDMTDETAYAGYIIGFESKNHAEDIISTIDREVEGVKCHYFYSFQSRHCAVINPEGINKMIGIHKKFEVEESELERLIFFGDGENDLPVFEEANRDSRIIAIPSPHTKDHSPVLIYSQWSKPLDISVCRVLGLL